MSNRAIRTRTYQVPQLGYLPQSLPSPDQYNGPHSSITARSMSRVQGSHGTHSIGKFAEASLGRIFSRTKKIVMVFFFFVSVIRVFLAF